MNVIELHYSGTKKTLYPRRDFAEVTKLMNPRTVNLHKDLLSTHL